MTHDEADSLIAAYAAHNLPDDVMGAMELHLKECSACREMYARHVVLHLTRSVSAVSAVAPAARPARPPRPTRPVARSWNRPLALVGLLVAATALLLVQRAPSDTPDLVPAGEGGPPSPDPSSDGAPRVQILAAQGGRLTPAFGGQIPQGAELVVYSEDAAAVFVVDGAQALELPRGPEGWRYTMDIPAEGVWVVAVRDTRDVRPSDLQQDGPARTRRLVTRTPP